MLSAHAPPTTRQRCEALALALLCAVLFLRDSLLPGRALVPYPPELLDVHMAAAVADGTFDAHDAFRGSVAMGDKYLQSLCWDRVMQDRFTSGELPRWTNDIGGGAPFVPQMAQPWQPINLLLFVLPSEQWYGWWYLLHLVLFGFFAYGFLRRLGCGHGASLLGLVCAALGLWTQCKLHHNVILTAALSLWPMLCAVHELVAVGARGRERKFAIGWLGLWTGLSWSTGFVVIALQATYLSLAVALLFALQCERGDRLRRLLPVALGLGLGAVLCAANMIPILLAAADSSRTASWSAEELQGLGLEWDHALTAAWPGLLSWPADHFYWPPEHPGAFVTRMPLSQLVLLEKPLRASDLSAFQSWVETSFAVGLVPLAAAAAAFADRERRALVLTFGAIALLAFGFATADQPFFAITRLVPGFAAGDLRRQLFTAAMALVVLAALGTDTLVRGGRRWPMVAVLVAVAAVSAIALGWLSRHDGDEAFARAMTQLWVADTDHPDVLALHGDVERATAGTLAKAAPGELAHNQMALSATAWVALAAALLGLLALWLPPRLRLPIWISITMLELLHTGCGPVQTVPAGRVTAMPAVLQPVAAAALPNGERPRLCRLAAKDAQSIAALPGNIPGFLGLEDSGAYNPLPPARYHEFIAAIEAGAVYRGSGVGSFHDAASLQHPLCDLYGMRFVLTKGALGMNERLADRTPPGTGVFRLYERPTTLPRATFVQQVDVIVDRATRLEALGARDRDVARRVVLEDREAPAVDGTVPARAQVTIVERRDERVAVTVRTQAAGYLRLADPWDAGWCATIDGAHTKVFVADHYLRAVHVPPGEHEVVFTYDGARVVWPLRVTLLAYAMVGWLLWTGRRKAT